MGVDLQEKHGFIYAEAEQLKGADISDFPV